MERAVEWVLILAIIFGAYLLIKWRPKIVVFIMAIAAFLIASGVFAALKYENEIREGKFIPALGVVVNFFSTPKDFSAHNHEKIDSRKSVYEIGFQTKYPGNYIIEIDSILGEAENLSANGSVMIEAIIKLDGNAIYSDKASQGLPYSDMSGNSGYRYIFMKSPENIPLGKKLVAEISILGDIDKNFPAAKGANIVVRKGSDE